MTAPLYIAVALLAVVVTRQFAPIVVITTEGAEADRRRAMSLGASAYLVKPVQAAQVVDAVKGLLRLT